MTVTEAAVTVTAEAAFAAERNARGGHGLAPFAAVSKVTSYNF